MVVEPVGLVSQLLSSKTNKLTLCIYLSLQNRFYLYVTDSLCKRKMPYRFSDDLSPVLNELEYECDSRAPEPYRAIPLALLHDVGSFCESNHSWLQSSVLKSSQELPVEDLEITEDIAPAVDHESGKEPNQIARSDFITDSCEAEFSFRCVQNDPTYSPQCSALLTGYPQAVGRKREREFNTSCHDCQPWRQHQCSDTRRNGSLELSNSSKTQNNSCYEGCMEHPLCEKFSRQRTYSSDDDDENAKNENTSMMEELVYAHPLLCEAESFAEIAALRHSSIYR